MTMGNEFNTIYRALLEEVTFYGYEETNSRTGVKIRALPGGQSFKLDLLRNRLPVLGNRRYFPRVAAAEVAWQFMGTQDPTFILAKAPKIWQDFVEDGKLKAAYGYRWKHHFGRDQLAQLIHQLRTNPTNRQLYVSSWDPETDGLGSPNQPKNIPCPVGFSVTTTGKELHMSVFVRSSDMFVGLPYDVMSYALTLEAIAMSTGHFPASLHFTLAHAHVYEPHWDAIAECLNQDWCEPCQPLMPGFSIENILDDPDNYLQTVKMLAGQVAHNPYNPLPPVVV